MKTFNEFLTEAYKTPVFTPGELSNLNKIKDTKEILKRLTGEWQLINGDQGQVEFFKWMDIITADLPNLKKDSELTSLKYAMTSQWTLK